MNFNLDIAIEDDGNCKRQKCGCENCEMGRAIFNLKLKDRIDDLCRMEFILMFSRFLKLYKE